MGRRIDSALKRSLLKAGCEGAPGLNAEGQRALAEEIRRALIVLTDVDDSATPPDPSLDAEVKILSIREAWLYRDWQTAIGEMMLEQSTGTARRFDVRGYRSFAELASQPATPDSAWIGRLVELTQDLDVSGDERYDARIGQLRGVFHALAQLIVDFHIAEPKRSSVSKRTLAEAKAVIATPAQASGS